MNNVQAIINFCFWVYNFNYDFIEKVWGGTHLEAHLKSKLKNFVDRQGVGYTNAQAIMDFIMDLSNDHKEKLFAYINENYKGGRFDS